MIAASRSGIQAGAARCFGTRNGAASSSSICCRVRTSGNFFSAFGKLQFAHRIVAQVLFVRRESDRRCGRRKIADECRSAPGSSSSARKGNRENHRARAFLPGRTICLRAKSRQRLPIEPTGCAAKRFARLRGSAETPRPADLVAGVTRFERDGYPATRAFRLVHKADRHSGFSIW